MQQQEITPEHLEVIKAGIKKISDFNVFSVRDIILHLQTLTSARASRMLMEAPGLYYRDLSFYVLSKSGMNRGHASMNENIQPLLPEGKATCYGFVLYPESFVRILLVEDNPDIAADFIKTLRQLYVFGDVVLLVAYGFDAAVSFFSTENVGLVIMDADLDDEEGDGVELTRRFSEQKQDVTILANSSSTLSNMKLTGFGAVEVLGKDPKKLRLWLQKNDPFGGGSEVVSSAGTIN